MSQLTKQLTLVHKRIIDAQQRFGRISDPIKLLAASKMQSIETIEEAIGLGLNCFGENYVQEAVPKITHFANRGLEWHFIGSIQSNKTRLLANYFDWVQTLTRVDHAKRLNDQRPLHLPPLQICIEVNVSQEPSKTGVLIDDLISLAKDIYQFPQLKLRGLMAIPELSADFESQRLPFKILNDLFKELQKQGFEIDTLSMGMSADIEAAVAEGSTLLRIGTALFGERG